MDAKALPTTDDVASEAVRSVYRRGFYDVTYLASQNEILMGQMLRLGEEVGEFEEARRNFHSVNAAQIELADVAIVLAQIAWLTGLPGSAMCFAAYGRASTYGSPLSHEYGRLCRRIREYGGNFTVVHIQLMNFSGHVAMTATAMQFDLEATIREKLVADEARGHRHGET